LYEYLLLSIVIINVIIIVIIIIIIIIKLTLIRKKETFWKGPLGAPNTALSKQKK